MQMFQYIEGRKIFVPKLQKKTQHDLNRELIKLKQIS